MLRTTRAGMSAETRPQGESCRSIRVVVLLMAKRGIQGSADVKSSKETGVTLRIGVIGAGMMGSMHASIAASLPNVALVAVADTNQKTLTEVSGKLGVPGYTSYEEMLDKNPDLQAVIVCTPDANHRNPAEAAAERGIHLLIEKPIARTVEDALRIIETAERNAITLMTAHLLRFDPSYAHAYEAVRAGDIGDVVHIYARRNGNILDARRLGGRTTLPFYCGVHDFDIMNWMTGDVADSVYSVANTSAIEDLGVYDSAFATFVYRGGTIACWESTFILPQNVGHSDMLLEVAGTDGVIYVDGYRSGISITTEKTFRMPDTRYNAPVRGRIVGALREQLVHFAECVESQRAPLISPEDALEAVRMACAIEESLDRQTKILIER